MKTCSICKVEKSFEDFNKKSSTKDGKQTACRECSHARFKAYYAVNRSKQRATVMARNNKYRNTIREWVVEYLKTHPCVDCGESDIRVLEFDHLPEFKKIKEVSIMIRGAYSLDTIKEEINKCEVRCRNHHAIKTYERMGGSWHDKFIKASLV